MSGQSQCTFFIAAKKRFCPLKVSKASASPFCPNHLPQLESNRIACSFCKAPILLSLLKKHTTKCNAKPPVSTPKYYCADVNRSIQSDPIPTPPHIRDLPLNELQTLIAKIRRAHEQIPKPHRILSEDAERSGEGKSKTQIQALIGRMADMNLLSSSLTFVEMGCGTAEFSHWVNEEIIKREKLENGVAHFILVDRDASRWKVKMDRGVFEKIRIDIKDLVLRKCASISRFDEKREVTVEGLVCISKHLCGAATDLALSCLKNYINSDPVVPLKSIVIALCCHHRCTFATYVNQEFIKDLRFTEQDFSQMCQISSWGAVSESVCCQVKESSPKRQRCDTEQEPNAKKDQSFVEELDDHSFPEEEARNYGSNGTHFSGLTLLERQLVGRQVKEILNAGRVIFLDKLMGRNSGTEEYIGRDVTPENVVLLC